MIMRLRNRFSERVMRECVEHSCFQTRSEARQTNFEYVECFYDGTRHSAMSVRLCMSK